jgi:dethiobiotin synthetase
MVEGVGGFLCPLTESLSIADFAIDIKLPVVIIAPLGLGTLNQTLLTIEAIRHRGLTPAGIILNQHIASEDSVVEASNPSELALRTDVPILACVQFGQLDVLRDPLAKCTINWEDLTRISSD